MNTIANKPSEMPMKKTPTTKKKAQVSLPSDRKILNALYKHYGKPNNIIKEKIKLFQEYKTPAGWKIPDWVEGEYQLGRGNVYVRGDDYDKYMFGGSAVIPPEGEGSWFIGVSQTHVKVWIRGKVDAILEIGE